MPWQHCRTVLAEGGYDPIVEILFNAFEVDRSLME